MSLRGSGLCTHKKIFFCEKCENKHFLFKLCHGANETLWCGILFSKHLWITWFLYFFILTVWYEQTKVKYYLVKSCCYLYIFLHYYFFQDLGYIDCFEAFFSPRYYIFNLFVVYFSSLINLYKCTKHDTYTASLLLLFCWKATFCLNNQNQINHSLKSQFVVQ